MKETTHGQHEKSHSVSDLNAWVIPAFNDACYHQTLRKLTYKPFPSEQGLNLKMEALDLAPMKFKKICRRATTKSIRVLFSLPEPYMVCLPLENVSSMGQMFVSCPQLQMPEEGICRLAHLQQGYDRRGRFLNHIDPLYSSGVGCVNGHTG